MTSTSIEWTDESWNNVRGCTHVSEGCRNCYAETQAYRFSKRPGMPYHGLVVLSDNGPKWTGDVRIIPHKLGEPLDWRKPRRVFVNSMSDTFHPKVPFDYIAVVFGVMAACSQKHTFQVLTKRPERAREFFRHIAELDWAKAGAEVFATANSVTVDPSVFACLTYAVELGAIPGDLAAASMGFDAWPLPNVWLGTSVEDQKTADQRIPELLQCPAAIHWISAEPLLGEVSLTDISPIQVGAAAHDVLRGITYWSPGNHGPLFGSQLGWVVVGGESGPRSRPCNINRIRLLVEQCRHARVPVFVKQLGRHSYEGNTEHWTWTGKHPKGGDPSEWPEELRVRQYPENKA